VHHLLLLRSDKLLFYIKNSVARASKLSTAQMFFSISQVYQEGAQTRLV